MGATVRMFPGDNPSPREQPQFFGQIPAVPWSTPKLSDRAKVVLGAITILARGRRTWIHATLAAIGEACGKKPRTVSRGLAELVRAGLITWESIGSNFVILFRIRGRDEASGPPDPPLFRVHRPGPDETPCTQPDLTDAPSPICPGLPAPLATPIKEANENERENVNVECLPEKTSAHAHASEVATPVEASPIETVDDDLANLTAEELRAKIDEQEPLTHDPRPMVRIDARMTRAKARSLLEAMEGTPEPAPTAPVKLPAPTAPVKLPAPTVPKPAGPPSIQTLLGRLIRVAGPEPVETFARAMAAELDDWGSIPFYRRLAEKVRRKEVDAKVVWEGVRRCRNREGGLRNRAAAFNSFVRQLE